MLKEKCFLRGLGRVGAGFSAEQSKCLATLWRCSARASLGPARGQQMILPPTPVECFTAKSPRKPVRVSDHAQCHLDDVTEKAYCVR